MVCAGGRDLLADKGDDTNAIRAMACKRGAWPNKILHAHAVMVAALLIVMGAPLWP